LEDYERYPYVFSGEFGTGYIELRARQGFEFVCAGVVVKHEEILDGDLVSVVRYDGCVMVRGIAHRHSKSGNLWLNRL
jgi:hypothetical protein